MKEATPKALRCTYMAACPSLYEVTPAEMRCAIGASCTALYEQEDGVLVIGKVLETVPTELLGKVGPDEAVVWVPKGLLKDIEWKD